MLDPIKQKLIDELIEHLEGSQGGDLAALMEEKKKSKPMDGIGEESDPAESDPADAIEDATEDGEENASANLTPKGVKVEKVEIMKDKSKLDGDPSKPDMEGTDNDMSDDELQELLKKYL